MRLKSEILVAWICTLLPGVLVSCQKETPDGPGTQAPELTVLIGTDGFGDGCYNDNLLEGILGFCKEHQEVRLSMQQPASIADAGKQLDAWLAQEGNGERALLLASNTYEPILRGKSAPKNGRVLILETDESFPGHSSYIIRRYGASWLCGAMSDNYSVIVMKAMDGNDMIDESVRGFEAGRKAVTDRSLAQWTLAGGPEGFAMRDSTYRFVYKRLKDYESMADILFFPLLGGSLSGLFDYRRYNGFVSITGMDVDCSVYDRGAVPYSLCVNNHLVLKNYLDDWLKGIPWPEHAQFGLESAFVQVTVNPDYQNGTVDLRPLYQRYYPQAIEKEKAYEVE